MKKADYLTKPDILRQKAEKLLKKKTLISALPLSYEDTLKLIHELEVNKIVLELQNNELKRAQEHGSNLASRKYMELYNFAPTAYLALTKKGEIVELNHCASEMLAAEHSSLKNKLFSSFINGKSKAEFKLFLDHIFTKKVKASCDLSLTSTNNSVACVHLSGIVSENRQQCFLTMVDITGRKCVEKEILRLNHDLECQVKERTGELEKTNTNLLAEITRGKKREDLIKQQLAEKEILLKEIHHRVKNNMQIILSMLRLQASFIKNDNIISVLQDIQYRIYAMALLHEKLYKSDNFVSIDFKEYLNNLCEYLFASFKHPSRNIRYSIRVRKINFNSETIISLGIIINELITNSFKHAFPGKVNGKIMISLKKFNDLNEILSVSDNGNRLPEKFNIKSTKSLGLQLVVMMVEQLRGKLQVQSSDTGKTFSIIFPCDKTLYKTGSK